MSEQIIRSRSGLRAKPLQTEQRVQMRYACSSDIAVQPLANRKAGVWSPAKVTNISAKGVGLMLTAPIERGTILSVKLEGPGQRFSRPLLLRVVRVVERPTGVWEAGCTFAIPLDEDEISVLLRTENAAQASVRTRPPVEPGGGAEAASDCPKGPEQRERAGASLLPPAPPVGQGRSLLRSGFPGNSGSTRTRWLSWRAQVTLPEAVYPRHHLASTQPTPLPDRCSGRRLRQVLPDAAIDVDTRCPVCPAASLRFSCCPWVASRLPKHEPARNRSATRHLIYRSRLFPVCHGQAACAQTISHQRLVSRSFPFVSVCST